MHLAKSKDGGGELVSPTCLSPAPAPLPQAPSRGAGGCSLSVSSSYLRDIRPLPQITASSVASKDTRKGFENSTNGRAAYTCNKCGQPNVDLINHTCITTRAPSPPVLNDQSSTTSARPLTFHGAPFKPALNDDAAMVERAVEGAVVRSGTREVPLPPPPPFSSALPVAHSASWKRAVDAAMAHSASWTDESATVDIMNDCDGETAMEATEVAQKGYLSVSESLLSLKATDCVTSRALHHSQTTPSLPTENNLLQVGLLHKKCIPSYSEQGNAGASAQTAAKAMQATVTKPKVPYHFVCSNQCVVRCTCVNSGAPPIGLHSGSKWLQLGSRRVPHREEGRMQHSTPASTSVVRIPDGRVAACITMNSAKSAVGSAGSGGGPWLFLLERAAPTTSPATDVWCFPSSPLSTAIDDPTNTIVDLLGSLMIVAPTASFMKTVRTWE